MSGAFLATGYNPFAFLTESAESGFRPIFSSVRPRFVWNGGSLTLVLPTTTLNYGLPTVGGDSEADSGQRAAYVVRRDETISFSLRFYEHEWPSVQAFLDIIQTGIPFTWFPDAERTTEALSVQLEAPVVGTVYRAVPDANYPRVQLLPLTVVRASFIPPPAPTPDFSAVPFRFYRRGKGYWQDWERTLAATAIGDPVGAWDDAMHPGTYFLADGISENFPPPAFGIIPNARAIIASGNRLAMHTNVNRAQFKFAQVGFLGGNGDIDDLHGVGAEIMIGVQRAADPPDLANQQAIWYTRWGGADVGEHPSGDTSQFWPDRITRHIWEHFGLTRNHDIGVPTQNLANGVHVYNVSGFDDGINPQRYSIWLDGQAKYDIDPVAAGFVIRYDSSHFWSFYPFGWIRDIVIFPGRLTESQRAIWTLYMQGILTVPPIPGFSL